MLIPNTPENYKANLRELAEKHIDIRLTEERQNFCVVSVINKINGLSDHDVRAFLDIQRAKSKGKTTVLENNLLMIAFELEGDADQDMMKAGRKNFTGSFALISKPENQTTERKEYVKNICYQAGMDIMGALYKFFKSNAHLIQLQETMDESIRIVPEYVGWRFDFTYSVVNGYCYNENKFENLTINIL